MTRAFSEANHKARCEAKLRGDKSFIPVDACPKGHFGIRHTGSGQCAQCHNEFRKQARANGSYKPTQEKEKQWRKDNRNGLRLKTYGLTPEQFEDLLKKQNYACAICRTTFKDGETEQRSRHIDHCHKSKIVRGILCMKCNLGLGYFCDNIKSLQAAISYLGPTVA